MLRTTPPSPQHGRTHCLRLFHRHTLSGVFGSRSLGGIWPWLLEHTACPPHLYLFSLEVRGPVSGDSATPSPRTNTHPFLGPCHEAALQVPDLPLPPSSDLNPGQIWSSWGSSQSCSFVLNNDFSKCQHTQSGGRETGHDKTHIFF